jgi:alpha-mannosidase
MKTSIQFFIVSRPVLLRMRIFQTKVIEKIKTHFLCSLAPRPPTEDHAVYEIICKNIVEPGRPQMTIWHLRSAC